MLINGPWPHHSILLFFATQRELARACKLERERERRNPNKLRHLHLGRQSVDSEVSPPALGARQRGVTLNYCIKNLHVIRHEKEEHLNYSKDIINRRFLVQVIKEGKGEVKFHGVATNRG